MKKKIISILTALGLMLTPLDLPISVLVSAEEESGSCGTGVTWKLDDSGTLTISGNGPMDDYESDSQPWFQTTGNNQKIKKVVIEYGVTTIGKLAFFQGNAIESVTISNTVTSIGFGAFYVGRGGGNKKLTEVVISDSVKKIGAQAFYGLEGLQKVTIGSSVEEIGSSAFKWCENLEIVEFKGTETFPTIDGSFGGCKFVNDKKQGIKLPSCVYLSKYLATSGWSELKDYIDPGHNISEVPANDATCTAEGNIQHWKCSVCQGLFSDAAGKNTTTAEDVTVDKLDHSWDDGIVTKNPTSDSAGEKTYTCTVCRTTKKESLPPTEDKPSDPQDPGTPADPQDPGTPADPQDQVTPADPQDQVTPADPQDSDTPSQPQDSATPVSPSSPAEDKGNISKEVEAGENVPNVELKTELNELITAVIPDEEREKISEKDDIKIVLQVEDAAVTVPADDKQKIDTILEKSENFKLGQYLDVTLLKIINESKTVITNTSKPITVTFEVPETLRNEGRFFSVIRIHGGAADILQDLDDEIHTVTIQSDRFSTYSLVYTDDAESGESGELEDLLDSVNSSEGEETAEESNQPESPEEQSSEEQSGEEQSAEDNKNPSTGAMLFISPTLISFLILALSKRKNK